MDKFDKLELDVETLRELTDEQLGGVAGGAVSGIPCNPTYVLPSRGGLFTMACPALDTITGTG